MGDRRWEEGGGQGKARQDEFFQLREDALHTLCGVHQRYSSPARLGLNGNKRGKMQCETGRREGKVQRERDSQSTEFLQALSDPHNQQGSS